MMPVANNSAVRVATSTIGDGSTRRRLVESWMISADICNPEPRALRDGERNLAGQNADSCRGERLPSFRRFDLRTAFFSFGFFFLAIAQLR